MLEVIAIERYTAADDAIDGARVKVGCVPDAAVILARFEDRGNVFRARSGLLLGGNAIGTRALEISEERIQLSRGFSVECSVMKGEDFYSIFSPGISCLAS